MNAPTAHVTIFAIPKPMEQPAARLQQNAFHSWSKLQPKVKIVLLGNETGIADSARQFGFEHISDISRNDRGTPLLSDCFHKARQQCTTPLMAYVNADILLGTDFIEYSQRLAVSNKNRFLGIGVRWESELEEDLCHWSTSQIEEWLVLQRKTAPPASVVCKDYFVFPRHLFLQIPDFAVGRGNWDNWMVYEAHRNGIPVIDLSDVVTAVHQPHGYNHAGGRKSAYMAGDEAKENQRLAGGRHLLVGSTASHRLLENGQIQPMGLRGISRALRDVPRFLRLLANFRDVPNKQTKMNSNS